MWKKSKGLNSPCRFLKRWLETFLMWDSLLPLELFVPCVQCQQWWWLSIVFMSFGVECQCCCDVTLSPPQTKAAYVLFYQRRDAGDVPAKPPASSPLGGATADAADDHMDTNWAALMLKDMTRTEAKKQTHFVDAHTKLLQWHKTSQSILLTPPSPVFYFILFCSYIVTKSQKALLDAWPARLPPGAGGLLMYET